jgi:hypothetical protein
MNLYCLCSWYCVFWLAWFGCPGTLRADPDAVSSPRLPPVEEIYFQAKGTFMATKEEARISALEEAREELARQLHERRIHRFILPSLEWLDRHLVVEPWTRTEEETIKEEKFVRVTVQLRLTSEHLRSFRKMERTSLSAVAAGLLAVVFLASWLYYRLDEWSKGYLTSWLAIGVVAAGSIVGGVWWWLHS